MYDKVPVLMGSLVAAVAPVIPGPSQGEWQSVAMAAIALLVRELVWWFRNRR